MAQEKQMDMLHGPLWNKILIFALPLAASSILQQLFSSADAAVVGHFAGSRALAAVGSNSAVINLLINIFVGLSVGANVIAARYIGEKRDERLSAAVHTAICTAVLSGVFVLVLGLFVTRPILELMSTPDDIIDLATVYLRVYFLGMPFIMIYNFGASVLRSCGDTKRPFMCLVISGVINIILNLFFVIICRLSVMGVGIATVISNAVSAAMVLRFLCRKEGALKLDLRKLRIDGKVLKDMSRIGIPAGVQSMVFSLSNICVQSSLNSLGSDIVAGSAAALNFEFFIYFAISAFSQANITFTSQNYGARKFKRCGRIMGLCSAASVITVIVLSSVFLIFGRSLLRIYTTEPEVIEWGFRRMTYILPFQFAGVMMDIASGSMRGMGYSAVPAVITVIGSCGLRLLWIYTVFAYRHDFFTLMMIYPISWVLTSAAQMTAYYVIRKN